jgi:hypothetical protein
MGEHCQGASGLHILNVSKRTLLPHLCSAGSCLSPLCLPLPSSSLPCLHLATGVGLMKDTSAPATSSAYDS